MIEIILIIISVINIILGGVYFSECHTQVSLFLIILGILILLITLTCFKILVFAIPLLFPVMIWGTVVLWRGEFVASISSAVSLAKASSLSVCQVPATVLEW